MAGWYTPVLTGPYSIARKVFPGHWRAPDLLKGQRSWERKLQSFWWLPDPEESPVQQGFRPQLVLLLGLPQGLVHIWPQGLWELSESKKLQAWQEGESTFYLISLVRDPRKGTF